LDGLFYKGHAMTVFSHLFQPLRVGSMITKNRLLMSAMSINFGVDKQGFVNEQLIEYITARAQGGVGMALVGGGGIHPGGVELPDLPVLWEDGCIPGLKQMTKAVKPYNCRLGMQLMHGGRQSYLDQKVAPSAIEAPALVKGVPRALTLEEIDMLVRAFGDAAARCKAAGFDFIEIHAAHGYLINQFLSPNSNIRTDGYGGGFENRIRFLLEVLADIRTKCGENFPVGVRLNGEDYIDNGWTLAEALRLAPILEEKGAAYLSISGGVYGSKQLTIPSMYVKQGCFVHLAEAVKTVVKIPVVAVGRIKSPLMADQIIAEEKADLVAMGRSLLADSQWPNKVNAGDVRHIRPCIGCCLGCIHAVYQLEPGGCVVNPDVGREYLHARLSPRTETPRKVLVVGAGPAGLAAARMLALRGHQVTICEEKADIGGALRLASKAPGRGELIDILKYFVEEINRLQVDLRCNTPLDDRLIQKVEPDEVVLATGSLPDMPLLKGLFQTEMQLCTVVEVLQEEALPEEKVIVWGGNQAGLIIADYLAGLGRSVTVLHRKGHFAEDMSANDRYYLRERLKQQKVTLIKEVKVETFLKDGVRLYVADQLQTLEDFNSVVLADTFVSLREQANPLRQQDLRVHFIGDAKEPRNLMFAISEGEELGRNL
jgi:2,4-dienoyl-CoA reductase-like NADH-dependent reductase (Old Yellow Enzyme family)